MRNRAKTLAPLLVAAVLTGILASLLLWQNVERDQIRTNLASSTHRLASAKNDAATAQASAAQARSDLEAADQQIQRLREQNGQLQGQVANLNAQVSTLNGQVSALSAQLASLQPSQCSSDPGVRANVNQASLEISGYSATQAVINYLCQTDQVAPGSIRSFFNSETLNDLKNRFGYP